MLPSEPDLVGLGKQCSVDNEPADFESSMDPLMTQQMEDAEVERCLDWRRQITVRGVVVAIIVGFVMSIISLNLSLTMGVIPSLNICAGLLGFGGVTSWVKTVARWVASTLEFSRQENTVIQTLAVAQMSTAFFLGFGSYMLAMDRTSWEQTGSNPDQESQIVELTYGTIIPYAFAVSFTGLFILVFLRKKFILDMQLTFPSGTATATMINGFFTEAGEQLAKKQFHSFGKWGVGSFLWSMFKWFFAGGAGCGFDNFPTLGLQALNWTFNFDFSINYIGAGMITGHLVNYSMLVGAIVSWGVLWPIISSHEGDWYPAGLPGSDLQGLLGYQVFISISIILVDGIYKIVQMGIIGLMQMRKRRNESRKSTKVEAVASAEDVDQDLRIRNRVFRQRDYPWWFLLTGYIGFAVLGIIVIPLIFPGTSWYELLVAYLMVPLFAIPNAILCGATDWDMSSTFGKLAIFLFASWANSIDPQNGIIAGLAACGIVFAGTSQAATLMQDFKTGYLTRSSPTAMFVAQGIGTVVGCLLSPVAFMMFYQNFDVGVKGTQYAAPYGTVYRAMAELGTEGFAALPTHCTEFMAGGAAIAILFNAMRDLAPKLLSEDKAKYALMFIPLPGAASIPFYLGANLAIDMALGSVVNLVWGHFDRDGNRDFHIPVASGLIAGDGIWSLPSALLAVGGVSSPICMSFATGG